MSTAGNSHFRIVIAGAVPSHLGSRNYGGVANVVWNLAKTLREQNENFAILALEKYFEANKNVDGIEILGLRLNFSALIHTIFLVLRNVNIVLSRPFQNSLKLIYAIYRLLLLKRSCDFDCLHVHHIVNQIPLAARLVGITQPIIVTMHGMDDKFWKVSETKRQQMVANNNEQLSFATAITWVSKTYKQQALNLGIGKSLEGSVIYNGLDFAKVEPNDNEVGIVVFIGNLKDNKGVKILARALELNPDNFAKCYWTGKGQCGQWLQEHPLTVDGKFELTGYLGKDELARQLQAASVLVVPSYSETFGLVYLEALSAGLPVIGYAPVLEEIRNVLGLSGVENAFVTGFNPNEQTANELSLLISEVLANSAIKSAQLKNAVMRKVREKFGWNELGAQYRQLYKKVLGN